MIKIICMVIALTAFSARADIALGNLPTTNAASAGDYVPLSKSYDGTNHTRNVSVQNLLSGVFNVTHYGAVGDDGIDDLLAITNAWLALRDNGGGTLYFPKGKYHVSDTLIVNTNIHILGDGMGHYYDISTIEIASTNKPVLLITNVMYALLDNIKLRNSTTNFGHPVLEQNAAYLEPRLDVRNVVFMNGGVNLQCSDNGSWDNVAFLGHNRGGNPYSISLRISNTVNPDNGDNSFHKVYFNQNAYCGIYVASSGGIQLSDSKFNQHGDTTRYDACIIIQPTGTTTIMQVNNVSFENFALHALLTANGNGATFGGIQMNNCEFLSQSGGTAPVLKLADGIGNNSSFANLVFLGGTASYFLEVSGMDNINCINFTDYTKAMTNINKISGTSIYYNFVAQ